MLKVENIYKKFNLQAGLFARYGEFVYAVNGVDLQLAKGESYGLVGESGCGKTTIARLIAGVYPVDSGRIVFAHGEESLSRQAALSSLQKQTLIRNVRYIFQDPARSLNPRMTIHSILTDGYKYSGLHTTKEAARMRAIEVLEQVGLSEEDLIRRPPEFSGGQRQRISIARALMTKPQLLICDEVVSALDVSVQSQIINLLVHIKKSENLTMLFISHDLGIVSYISDRVGVAYGGRIVEEGEAREILKNHLHPYTKLLYSSVSDELSFKPNETKNDEVYDSTTSLHECPFYARCPKRLPVCKTAIPSLKMVNEKTKHKVACFAVSS